MRSAFQVLKMFLDRGVPPTYTDILNQTVLYYVARENKINCVETLVKLGSQSLPTPRLQRQSPRPVRPNPALLRREVRLKPHAVEKDTHSSLSSSSNSARMLIARTAMGRQRSFIARGKGGRRRAR